MGSDRKTVDTILDQIAGAGVTARAMFGEYSLYCDGRVIGFVADDQLLIKLTTGGRAFASDADEAPPYPGAKPCLRIDAERWDDREWLAELVRITAAQVPLPKPKPAKRKPG
jgi:TfoX/Sxy family transcriptional regulator of competence genes